MHFSIPDKASYRLIDHMSEGQTGKVSALRGRSVDAAAKCIMLMVKIGKKTSRFVLAVVPGNARVDTAKIKSLFSGVTYAGFAATGVAERLAGSVASTVLPFAFHPDLMLARPHRLPGMRSCCSTLLGSTDRWRRAKQIATTEEGRRPRGRQPLTPQTSKRPREGGLSHLNLRPRLWQP
ncbi:MAG TPA: YbaK/EbsC family protein [Bradyrhizobium sp.]|nr:YbaK/EbsC family protein [Bradyrhizobium sp.]